MVAESPALTADLAIPSEQVLSELSSLSALLFPWWVIDFLSKIDACNRRAVNSIYFVLILFNPIHISVSETWQDVRSHSVSTEIFL